jgi:hypothetical protein
LANLDIPISDMSNVPAPIEPDSDGTPIHTFTTAELGNAIRAYLLTNNLGVPVDLHQEGDPVPGNPIINVAPAAVTIPAVTPAPPPLKHPKVATPENYTGDRSQWKQFKAQCQLYIDTRYSEFPNDRAKISFMLSYMKGGMAGPWALNFLMSHANPHVPYPLYQEFIRDLELAFGDPNPGVTARTKLANLKMGSGSCDKYITKFDILAAEAGLNDTGLSDHFQRGLDPDLKQIYSVEHLPTTYLGFKTLALRFDNQKRNYESLFKAIGPTSGPKASRSHGTSSFQSSSSRSIANSNQPTSTFYSTPAIAPVPSSGPWPMDVDSVRSRLINGKLPKEELERRIRENLCTYCGAAGHLKDACPSRKSGKGKPQA